MATRIFGSGIRRHEDPRLMTGTATYTDDLTLPGMLHAAMLRSPHAHARITRIDVSGARSAPGVVAAYAGADADALKPVPCAWLLPNADLKIAGYQAIARDTVRYVGDIVAVVVAETTHQAYDALELIEVDYDPLPSVTDPQAALAAGAPQLHPDIPNNEAFHWTVAGGDIDAAFRTAEIVVKERIVQQRLIPNAMEPRAALAQWGGASGDLTLWNTTQNPHILRFLCSVVTGVPENKLRVIAPEVGGGFGSKIAAYPADFITCLCSMKLNRPVKWTETRSENYQATTHGRDHVQEVELAARKDGTILGLRATVWAGMGAYLSTAAPGIPTILHGLMLSGVYNLPAVKEDVHGVYTNTTPVEAYRGAGRPEATFMIERLIDKLGSTLGVDAAAIRLKNMIPRFENGHAVVTGLTYDSGDYPAGLKKAARPRQVRGPAQGAGRRPREGPLSWHRRWPRMWRSAVSAPRRWPARSAFRAACGRARSSACTRPARCTSSSAPRRTGRARRPRSRSWSRARSASDVDDVKVMHGDTDTTPMGWGTYGSRTTAVGGAALILATRKVKEKAKVVAAHLLEAAVEDMDYADGKFFVKGSPDKAKTIQDVALMANVAWNMPAGVESGLEASMFYDPPNFTYPFGSHVAVVEIDPETGHVDLKRYVAVDDCGPQINPVIVEGQVHGGVVQGIGQALWEEAVYDENGQLVTGSMLDYALPRADQLCDIEVISTVTPSPHHPLGLKGIGEAGTIASTVTVYNAVLDALAPLGVTTIRMPMTAERVWRAMQQAQPANRS